MSKKTDGKTGRAKVVHVNRGDADSYYTSASKKLSLSKIEKQVRQETRRINQIKIPVTP